MAVQFTKEQQQVIDLHNRNILVSAAAGSGKTAVLTQRIVKMVSEGEHPLDIDRLLVVTYTNAAAAEMRERIGKALEKRLEEEPQNEHLQKQTALIHRAQITTIDSFCLNVLRNHFNSIGLDPAFRLADEGERKLLEIDVLKDFLEEKYDRGEQSFLDCASYFAPGNSDDSLEEYIHGLYKNSLAYPSPVKWLDECAESYKISDVAQLKNELWYKALMQHIHGVLDGIHNKLKKALEICNRPDGPFPYADRIEEELEKITEIIEISKSENFDEICEALSGLEFGKLPSVTAKHEVNPVLKDMAYSMRKQAMETVKSTKQKYFAMSMAGVLDRMHTISPYVSTLSELAKEYKLKLDLRKRELNIIDFSDMELLALEILIQDDRPTAAALEYRSYFDEILIDEYQDSNMIQEKILWAVSSEDLGRHNRFMVGDVKQSIYKFRLACPELFVDKYNRYTKEESDCQRIDLSMNFRSRDEVVNTVNEVFSKLMKMENGGIEYDDAAALHRGAAFPESSGNESELLIFQIESDDEKKGKEAEAMMIAHRIKKLRAENKITVKEKRRKEDGSIEEVQVLRPVDYRDIVILLRTTRGWGEEFKEVLQREGIPAYISTKTGFFGVKEIKDVLNYLQIMNNPLQDIPLFGALKSYFGGFSDAEIAEIRVVGEEALKDKEGVHYLYDCLNIYRGELESKIQDFLYKLKEYRRKSAYTPIHELLNDIIHNTCYYEHVLALPGGEQRGANVLMLPVKAADFEKTSFHGLFHFLRYMDQLRKYEEDYGEADLSDENANVVRIMSIHGSKGLEFPVCFVSGITKGINQQDSKGAIVSDRNLGLGVDYINPELHVKGTTLKKTVIADQIRLDSIAEEMRVLYVAMTRPKEKLIMTGTFSGSEKLEQKILQYEEMHQSGEGISGYEFGEIKSFLDMLMPIISKVTRFSAEDLNEERIASEVCRIIDKDELTEIIHHSDETSSLKEKFEKKMNQAYPYEYRRGLVQKTSVSELKMKAMDAEDAALLHEDRERTAYIPGFAAEGENISGADRGSAYHRVMELLDFESISDSKDITSVIKEQMTGFVRDGFLTQEWFDAVNVSKIANFFNSDLAKSMTEAQKNGRLRKEQPFVLAIEANRVNADIPSGENVLIQGIIDAFYEEDGQIVLMDYKTDHVDNEEALIKRYRVQMDLYAEALSRITGKTLKAIYIYSFSLAKTIPVLL